MNDQPVTELDVIGLHCPLPVLKARQIMRRLKTGDQLLIAATDPLAVIDIPHFCREDGHTLVSTSESNGVHRFTVVKGKDNQT